MPQQRTHHRGLQRLERRLRDNGGILLESRRLFVLCKLFVYMKTHESIHALKLLKWLEGWNEWVSDGPSNHNLCSAHQRKNRNTVHTQCAFSGLFSSPDTGPRAIFLTCLLLWLACSKKYNENPFSLVLSCMGPKWIPVFIVNSLPIGPLQICLWPESQIQNNVIIQETHCLLQVGGREAKHAAKTSLHLSHLTFPSCQNSQSMSACWPERH